VCVFDETGPTGWGSKKVTNNNIGSTHYTPHRAPRVKKPLYIQNGFRKKGEMGRRGKRRYKKE
jgi:hypothetical protein